MQLSGVGGGAICILRMGGGVQNVLSLMSLTPRAHHDQVQLHIYSPEYQTDKVAQCHFPYQ